VAEIIASGPRAPFLAEAARVLQPGGRILINATQGNAFGRLPSVETLNHLQLHIIQYAELLRQRFAGHTFRRTDGSVIPTSAVRTTMLEKNR
jgi:ubiquinone/menaquinone biosynthesis C-methylase UbiE